MASKIKTFTKSQIGVSVLYAVKICKAESRPLLQKQQKNLELSKAKLKNWFAMVKHFVKYSRHFSFVECNDITTRSSRSFDKFILQN